jgi:hypothetical protein
MIFVCGDTHLDIDIEKLDEINWPEGYELTKHDYLIILGDVGLVWFLNTNERERDLLDWFDNRPWTTLFIDGNHENFDRLFSDEFKLIHMFDSGVKQISNSIFYLQRGHVYIIENKTFFTFGGGESIDKAARSPYVDWWPQELPSYAETNFAISNLKKYDNSVDFILTHACSEFVFDKLMVKANLRYKQDSERVLRSFFDWVETNIRFRQWHFGHYHDDFILDNKHYTHYNQKPMEVT